VEDQIVQEIEHWRERRLHALKDVPAVDMDSWLRYTNWHEVLSGSGHGILKTSRLAREQSDPDEPGLERVLRAWGLHFGAVLGHAGCYRPEVLEYSIRGRIMVNSLEVRRCLVLRKFSGFLGDSVIMSVYKYGTNSVRKHHP
jgi:hypothetical protein